MKTGDYFKLVGGFDGVYWNGRRWVRFDCETCGREQGFLLSRIQGPMTPKAGQVMQFGVVEHRHSAELHQQYIQKHSSRIRL